MSALHTVHTAYAHYYTYVQTKGLYINQSSLTYKPCIEEEINEVFWILIKLISHISLEYNIYTLTLQYYIFGQF